MFLKELHLKHFKSHTSFNVDFTNRISLICGVNGSGKTNVLDALGLIGRGKPFFAESDLRCIQDGLAFFRVEGMVEDNDGVTKNILVFHDGSKKRIQLDHEEVMSRSSMASWFPMLMHSPYSFRLITGGAEERRRWMDRILSMIDPSYLQSRLNYQKVLTQRTEFVKKNGMASHQPITELLDVYDEQLFELGRSLFNERLRFVKGLKEIFDQTVDQFEFAGRNLQFDYLSVYHHDDPKSQQRKARSNDLRLGRSTWGVHRDDLQFTLKNSKLRWEGSQGQQKVFLLAMLFAAAQFVESRSGKTPLLLFDDVFDRLDEHRQSLFAQTIDAIDNQVMLTHTSKNYPASFCDRIGIFDLTPLP
ncbi:MAG: DNA replication/repair protein RecF [Chitinophagales bacterium]